MRDYFWQRMESDRGDLADIVRSGGWAGGASGTGTDQIPAIKDWHLPSDPSALFPSDGVNGTNNFGDPFASLYDPLLNELTGIEFFSNSNSSSSRCNNNNNEGESDGGTPMPPQKLLVGEEKMKTPPRRITPRVLFQVASAAGSRGITACPLSPPEAILVGEMVKVSSGVCSVDDGGVQFSSTRTLGIKRRKNQVKRVVCIPAPAAASSRASGEVVPSDLWAWRKYGQKPIKGSPYPRGYYRCSSSKGCSARKQVERSRTNPNMLVVTYTSEHNHPWPTQRNALAGSTRSQGAATCKNTKNINTICSTLRIKSDPLKEAEECPPGQKEEAEEEGQSSGLISTSTLVKEETINISSTAAAAGDDDGLAVVVNKDGGAAHDDDHYTDHRITSREMQEADDGCWFTDLAELELESDPMSLIFSKVLLQSKPAGENASYISDALDMFD